jgi:Secreted protein containing C-terminal beta-propeller domain distantly related to WD-40 repeats
MNDEKILDKIKQSANSCEVPESLKPENIADKLSDKKKVNMNKRIYQIGGLAAAAFVLVIGISMMPRINIGIIGGADGPTSAFIAGANEEAVAEEPSAEKASEAGVEVVEARNEEFSKVFRTAGDYDDVIDTMDAYEEAMRKEAESYTSGSDDISLFDRIFRRDAKSEMVYEEVAAEEPAAEQEAAPAETSMADMGGGGNTSDYSKTNLQVEGVDEGDVIKTDGKYIYIIRENREIRIIKIDGADMEETATVKIDNVNGDETVWEIYLDGDKLSIITGGYGNGLREASEDTFYMDYRAVTSIYTYDLSNPAAPKLLGKVSQDGDYNTSRKVGDYIYLFTSFQPKYVGSLARNNSDNGYVDMVPYVGEEMIEPASIYLPIEPHTTGYMVMSSVNLNKPSETVDRKAIMENANDFYVTTKNIYVRKENWNYNGYNSTSIAKFSFKDGKIKGESAGVVPGRITDTFAINEYKDTLRVLTTASDGGWEGEENIVTVFDDRMNVTGQIRGLAKGETIYSARFLGEMGYFVTYRNVDPLFAVDFSDPRNPEILGELKITGFSEYLHFYGKDKLLGIGWETDPETGQRKGMKLSMFDISNPVNLKEIDKIVVQNVDSFLGEYDYKALTVSPEKNIIGLATSWWGEQNAGYNYMVFSYEEGRGFKNQLSYSFAPEDRNSWEYEKARGLYIGDIFYVVTYNNIYAFDMEQGYRKVGEL